MGSVCPAILQNTFSTQIIIHVIHANSFGMGRIWTCSANLAIRHAIHVLAQKLTTVHLAIMYFITLTE